MHILCAWWAPIGCGGDKRGGGLPAHHLDFQAPSDPVLPCQVFCYWWPWWSCFIFSSLSTLMTIEKEGCSTMWSSLVLQGFCSCHWWPWSCYKMVVITLITIKPLCLSQYEADNLTYVCRQVLCCAFPSVSTRVYAVGGEDGVQVESNRSFIVNVELHNLWSF